MNYFVPKNNILDLIGNTPIIELKEFSPNKNVKIFAKLEYLNPSGSIKDRIAKYMIEKAEKNGKLKKGMTIVEATSGNTGIAFSMVASIKGYKMFAVMPEFSSKERIKIMKHYGANVILTPAEKNVKGTVEAAKKLTKKLNAFMLNQFENPDNMEAHYETTGKEILNQIKEKIDVFVAGVGTGGTLLGVAKRLKEKNKETRIIALEPESSPILTKGEIGPHKIEGIGEGFIPKLIENNIKLIDKIMTVKDENAINTAKQLTKKHGLFVGISSGANVYAATQIAKKMEKGIIITVLPDGADRYYSTELFR